MIQLEEYGRTGLPYIVKKWPDLSSVYYINKINSSNINDRIFEMATLGLFRKSGMFLYQLPMPWRMRKLLMNYLVLAHIHKGFRNRK